MRETRNECRVLVGKFEGKYDPLKDVLWKRTLAMILQEFLSI